MVGQLDNYLEKKIRLVPYITPYIKINFTWMGKYILLFSYNGKA